VKQVAASPEVLGFKLYPAGATTHSDAGVADIHASAPIFEALQEAGVPLLIHGEVTDSDCDIFDREQRFIDSHLRWITDCFPALKVVLEHVTTEEAVAFVEAAALNVAATITPQHLLFNRNAMLVGGIRPHFYCLPVLKRESHRLALLRAATSGNPKFFLGTDSAPHLTTLKENACGCAGCYSAPVALSLYAQAFEQADALDTLEGFASHFGADFYGLPRNTRQIQLTKQAWSVPHQFGDAETLLTPLQAGETLSWQIETLAV
jgi:dihydroorotase